MKEKMKNCFKLYGIEWPVFVVFAVVIFACAWMEIIPNQMIGGIAVLFGLGILFGELGEHIPIWNKYCGGGAILCFLVCGLMTYFNVLPQCAVDVATGWMSDYSFLNVFISLLIVGSLLGMDRNVLVKSGSLFIPAILAGIVGSAVFGIIGGLIFGKTPIEILTAYVLPIMGGGAGAGAVPMAQVYTDVTGQDSSSYLSFALAILAVANIVAVIFGIILDVIGRAFPALTGDGSTLLRDKSKEVKVEREKEIPITMDDVAAGIFLTAGFFLLGQLFAKKILPTIFGVSIPNFAYMIIFAALANIFNLIPDHLRKGAQTCQQFCGNKLVWVQMCGVGIVLIDFKTMLSVLSIGNLIIVILIVFGACLGTAVFGYYICGFHAVDSAVTAGLCMANMGGAGDLAVLGAARRMDLMSYAQISSRIGGAIILLIGSLCFQFL